MLVVEDILLLITATPKRGLAYVDLIVAAGLLTDLTLAGNVRVTESGESTRRNRIVAVPDAAWPTDPLLADAAEVIAGKPQWWPTSVLEKLARGLPNRVYERLARAELVSADERKILGVFPSTRWSVIDRRRVDELEAALDEVVLFGAEPDLSTAALTAVLSAGGLIVPVLDRGRKIDKKAVKQRAKAFQQQYWTAEALEKALQARDVATTAAASG